MYEEIFERKEQILSSHGQKTATQETLFIYSKRVSGRIRVDPIRMY